MVGSAARRGCGAAVVFAAGFAEAGSGALQAELAAAAGAMPVLGPNCDGLVAFHRRRAVGRRAGAAAGRAASR